MSRGEGEGAVKRRTVLAALGALGSGAWAACGGSSPAGPDGGPDADAAAGDAADAASEATSAASCNIIPDETAGPYLDQKGMIGNPAGFRSDITEGKPGVPLTLVLTVLDAAKGCAPIANANVEIWHCDADGIYSEYVDATNPGSTATTYLRGVQTTDAAGRVTFKTIYPGWYAPRAPHIHVRVYDGVNLKETTQFGFPEAVNATVYGGGGAYTKGPSPTANDDDSEFGNGSALGTALGGHDFQIAAVTGSNAAGYVATLPVTLADF
jgi:protocatechuate 3,4-dioxygenase beta subunit